MNLWFMNMFLKKLSESACTCNVYVQVIVNSISVYSQLERGQLFFPKTETTPRNQSIVAGKFTDDETLHFPLATL